MGMNYKKLRKRYLRQKRIAQACRAARFEWQGKPPKAARILSREDVERIAAERGWSVANKLLNDRAPWK